MPSKSTKKARRTTPTLKQRDDSAEPDAKRYVIVGEGGRQIYPGEGVPHEEAQRLASGLVVEARLVEV